MMRPFDFLNRSLSVCAVAMGALCMAAASASAADLPCSTAKMIVPWGAGGDTDIILRAIVDASNRTGSKPPLQVVNVGGQGGNKGAKEVKDGATPDGCTLLALHDSAHISYLVGRIDFTWEAFEPVALMAYTPSIIGASKQAPYNTMKDLVAAAKKAPNSITTGATLGSTSQFPFILIEDATGIRLKYVPYEGTRQRITALLGNNIELAEMNIITAKQYLKEGSLKALGIAMEARDPLLPDLPTLKEQGIDVVYGTNRGVVAPKGTKPEVIAHWDAVFAKAAKDPEFVRVLETQGTLVAYKGSKDFRAFLEKSFSTHKTAATNLGILKK